VFTDYLDSASDVGVYDEKKRIVVDICKYSSLRAIVYYVQVCMVCGILFPIDTSDYDTEFRKDMHHNS
jgi:hypothetical protein